MLLFYRQYGTGFPVLILHGLLGMSDNWMSIASKLATNFKIIVPDLRNHGQSFHAEEMTYEVMADDVIFLCEYLKIFKCSIIGHSMGGKVAITVAQKRPDLINKLIIVDIGLSNTFKSADNVKKILDLIKNIDIRYYKERSQIANYFEGIGLDKKIIQLILKNIYFSKNKMWEWKFNLDFISLNIRNIMTELVLSNVIEVDTLFIKGSLSDYLDENAIEAIKQWFLNVRILEIANAGHWVHVDNPQQFIDAVIQFL